MTDFGPLPTDYLIQVTSDKFRDQGILPGDYVAVHQQADATPGQLVMANIDGAGDLKHYEPGDKVLGVVTWVMGKRS